METARKNYSHVDGFFKILQAIEKENPDKLCDGDRLWNVAGTKVALEFGKRTTVLGCSDTHHDEFLSSSVAC